MSLFDAASCFVLTRVTTVRRRRTACLAELVALSVSSSFPTMSGPTSSSPITQVSQHAPAAQLGLQPQLLTRLQLELRGRRFSVDRETIMNLPESVLLCLFPNGLVLSRQSAAFSDAGDDDGEDEQVYGVDVCAPSHPICTPNTALTLSHSV
jgi:hypothetical protein